MKTKQIDLLPQSLMLKMTCLCLSVLNNQYQIHNIMSLSTTLNAHQLNNMRIKLTIIN